MAFRDITVFIKANTVGLKAGLTSASGDINRFGRSIGNASKQTQSFTKSTSHASQNLKSFNRGAGAGASQVDRLSGSLRRGQSMWGAMAQQTTLAGKAMAGFKTLAQQVIMSLGGFLAIYGAIQLITGGLSSGVNAWRDFNKELTYSMAIMGDLSDEMVGRLSDGVRELAKNYAFSASEIAGALFFLASAGLDASQSLMVLEESVQFAQAGGFDLVKATEYLTDAQAAMGMVVRDAAGQIMLYPEAAGAAAESFEESFTRMGNVLVKANIIANAEVDQFAQALTTKSAAAARQLGISLEETTAVLAVFANQGIKGQVAGTAFSMVLRDMTTKAIRNGEAFESMGIQVFDAQGDFRGFANVIGDMENAFKGMSDQEIRTSLLTLGFTDRSVAATSALLGTSNQIAAFNGQLLDSDGIMKEVSDKQLESFNGKLTLVGNTLKDVAIGAGEAFNKWLNSLGKNSHLQDIVGGIESVGEAMLPVIKAAGNIVKVFTTGAFGLIALTFGTIGQAAEKFTVAANALAVVLSVRLMSSFIGLSGKMISGTTIAARYTVELLRQQLMMGQYATGLTGITYKLTMVERATMRLRAAQTALGASFAATAAAAKKGISGFLTAGNVFALAAVGVLTWQSTMKAARAEAEAAFAPLTSAFEAAKGVDAATEAFNRMAEAGMEAKEANDEYFDGVWGGVRALKTSVASMIGMQTEGSKVAAALDAQEAAVTRARTQLALYTGNLHNASTAMGYNESRIIAAADAFGIDLHEALEVGGDDWVKIQTHLRAADSQLVQNGISTEELASLSEEEFGAMAEDVAELEKGFNESMTSMLDPIEILKNSIMTLPTIADSMSGLKDDIQQAYDDANEATMEGARDSVDALRDQRDASLEARADVVDGMEDLSADEKDIEADITEGMRDQWDARIEAAEQGVEGLADSIQNGTARIPTFGEILSRFGEDRKASSDFADQLDEILSQGLAEFSNNPEMLNNVSNAVEFLRELGPEEGGPLAGQILDDLSGFVADYNTELAQIGVVEDASLEQYLDDLIIAQAQFWDKQRQLMTIGAASAELGLQSGDLEAMAQEMNDTQFAELAALVDSGDFEDLIEARRIVDERRESQLLASLNTGLGIDLQQAFVRGDDAAIRSLLDNNKEELATLLENYDGEMVDELTDTILAHLGSISAETKRVLDESGLSDILNFSFTGSSQTTKTKRTPEEAAAFVQQQNIERQEALKEMNSTDAIAAVAAYGGDRAKIDTGYELAQLAAYGEWALDNAERAGKLDPAFREASGFANGGIVGPERHRPGIYHSQRIFAEPETGGEAYIPLGRSKRSQSMAILSQVAQMFGTSLAPAMFANGGIIGTSPTSGGGSGPSVITVEVPQSAQTNYNFGNITASDPEATIRYAQRQARRRNLTSISRG